MTTHDNTARLVTTVAAALLLLGISSVAEAGRGGSAARIQNAVSTGSADAIIAELERAERLVCAACIEPVMELLDHQDYRVREAAAWWFARRPAQKKELHERSLAVLQGNDSTAARNAADILGTFRHPRAIPALAQAAGRSDLDAGARAHAVRALGTIGHRSANDALTAAMSDADPGVRFEAVRAWLAIRRQEGAAPVVELVDDADVKVRRKAAAVVGNLREASARQALEAQLSTDDDPVVRRNAAWALGRIGDSASRAALEAATDDPSSLVRRTAEVAMYQLR